MKKVPFYSIINIVVPVFFRLMNEITGWFLGQKEEWQRKEVNTRTMQQKQRQRKAKKVYTPSNSNNQVSTSELDSYSTEYR